MAKEIMAQWREGLAEALDAMGIDHRNVRRLVIEVGPGAFPVMHVEMIADPRIIDVAAVLVASSHVRVRRDTVADAIKAAVAIRSDLPGSDRGA